MKPGALLGLAFLACGVPDRAAQNGADDAPPNIVLMISDDHSYFDLSCCGTPGLPTPTLDRFREEAMQLTHAFTPTAICVPSRAALMTGGHSTRSGVVGFGKKHGRVVEGVPTLSELMNEAGYRTGLVGKSHLHPFYRHPFSFYDEEHRRERLPEEFASRVEAFMAEDDGRPFFLVIAFTDPHRPFPRDASADSRTPRRDITVPPHLFDLPFVRAEISRYYDAVKRLDRSVAASLEALEPHLGDALVLFTSDHGHSFPFAKSTLYDAGVRVPLFARWPGRIQPNTTRDSLISFVDFMPTLLQVAGREDLIPSDVEGRSFLQALKGEAYEERRYLFLSHTWNIRGLFPSRGVRSDRFKYIYNFPVEERFTSESQTGATWASMVELAKTNRVAAARVRKYGIRPREELYDLERDPFELVNLAGDPSHAPTRKRLTRALRAWMKAQGDPWLEQWDDPDASD